MTNLELLKLAHKIQIYYFEKGVSCDVYFGEYPLKQEPLTVVIGNVVPFTVLRTEESIVNHAKAIGVVNTLERPPMTEFVGKGHKPRTYNVS